jgi:hypothetical protein
MSPRSIYFRDQADACWQLAILLTDAETQEQLRKTAIELIERAAEIEGKETMHPAAFLESYRGHQENVTFGALSHTPRTGEGVTMEIKPPAPRALAALNLPTPVLPDKPLPVTPKVRRAILLFVNGDCKQITEAAEKVGLARESLSKALDRPHVIAYLQQRTRKRLEILAARAGAVKGELLDSDNEMVRDRASSFVLGLAGIQPATTPGIALNLEIRAGYVIDLTGDSGERPGDIGMRIVSSAVRPAAVDIEQDSAE